MPWGKSTRTSQARPEARAASPTKQMERARSAVTVPVSSAADRARIAFLIAANLEQKIV
jgi:hypothetical protein